MKSIADSWWEQTITDNLRVKTVKCQGKWLWTTESESLAGNWVLGKRLNVPGEIDDIPKMVYNKQWKIETKRFINAGRLKSCFITDKNFKKVAHSVIQILNNFLTISKDFFCEK